MKRKRYAPLTEPEWSRVFAIRCRTKRGESISADDAHLIARAFATGQDRYNAMNERVFEATKPWPDRERPSK